MHNDHRTTLAMTVIGAGKYLRLVAEDGWEYVERIRGSGVVAVVAVTGQSELLLTEQYRPAVRRRVIDLPSGLSGDVRGCENEPLVQAARRELLEETGYRARRMRRLFTGPPSAGMSSELVTFFRAEDVLAVGDGGGEGSEAIIVHRVPINVATRWLRRARRRALIDPKVYVGLYWAAHTGDA